MAKYRIARWANRRRGGRHKPIYRIEAAVISGRYVARLQWREVKRYRTAVVRLPKEVRRKGWRKSDRVRIPVEGKVLAEVSRPKQEFWARSSTIPNYVATYLVKPEPRRR